MPLSQVLFVSGPKQGARWCSLLLSSINHLFPDTLCAPRITPWICCRERDRPGLRPARAVCRRRQPATCDLQPATCDLQGRGLGCASSRGPVPPPVCAAFLGKSHGLKRPCRDLAEARGAVRRGAGSRMRAPSLRRETAWSPGGSRTCRARHVPARSPGPMRGVGKSRSRVPEQGSEGLYIMPTRVAFMDSNPDDYICNLITAGLFLESALKARDRKRLSFPLPARTKPHVK